MFKVICGRAYHWYNMQCSRSYVAVHTTGTICSVQGHMWPCVPLVQYAVFKVICGRAYHWYNMQCSRSYVAMHTTGTICSVQGHIWPCIPRVCYLARARAMARVVLAQFEFTRAICGSRKILYVLR